MKDAAGGVENSIRQEATQTETQLMSAIDAPPHSSLEFGEHAEVPADASPQLELPLASAEPAPPAAADNPK